jgi:hypothetical protein
VDEASGGAIGVNDHSADGVDRQSVCTQTPSRSAANASMGCATFFRD